MSINKCEIEMKIFLYIFFFISYCALEYSLDNAKTAELKKMCHVLNSKIEDEVMSEDSIYYAVYTIIRVKDINIKVHNR